MADQRGRNIWQCRTEYHPQRWTEELRSGLSRAFRITEKVSLQFRSEFFNLANHPNFALPTQSAAGSSFATISRAAFQSQTGAQRQMPRPFLDVPGAPEILHDATRLGDHRALFWAFVLFTPLQYVLVGMNQYQLFNVLIPVYAFLFVPARIALSGDFKRYLERVAKIQTGLMICVFCLSFAPALLYREIEPGAGSNYRLLFFFILIVQMGDALQYIWGKLIGQHVIVASISPNRTWEGFLGGVGSNTLLGAALWWAIPPFQPWQAGILALVASVMGFFGGLTMSAIKRDRGVKDYGTLVEGHGGVLDRIDSICFAAPVFYHLTRVMFPG